MTDKAIEAAAKVMYEQEGGEAWESEDTRFKTSVYIIPMRAAIAAYEQAVWRPIEEAPKDGTLFLVWCPSYAGLPSMFSLCAWHPDAGFCVDELREPTHYRPLPPSPGTPEVLETDYP